jgi:hypothetical protein
MAKSNTRKYIIWGSGAVLIGAIGYILWKKYRKPKEETKSSDDVVTDPNQNQNQNQNNNKPPVNPPAAPTQAEIDLATKYRAWANSTDALSQKWGKKSNYDLDATSSNPTGGTFRRSYDGGGKVAYEAALKVQEVAAKTIKKGDYVLVTTRAKQNTYYGDTLPANFKGKVKSAPANYKYKVNWFSKDSATGENIAYIFNKGDKTEGYVNGTGFQIYTKYLKKTTF